MVRDFLRTCLSIDLKPSSTQAGRLPLYVSAALLLLFSLGCGGASPQPASGVATSSGTNKDKPHVQDRDDIFYALMDQFADWKGTRYQYGGQSRNGVDCSGFVQLTYKHQFGVNLPRTTKLQARLGPEVSRKKLQVGDLVFFQTGIHVRHVGMYLGNQQFLHASSSKGVTISRMDTAYWSQRFWKATRPLS
ncbi:MAG: hypothetical protein HKN21_15855 [Candidatus Eisenbacteria bacterium]|uniref:NlpC/P60 domain-containing protein n=1 Tax=Eiseniibacteriota bacterium TaxID=2212470 RepID=A0A7Y2EAH5_UNCEI|nr:hypothetical protein [Candidatus Eisenbacteria bacterium]